MLLLLILNATLTFSPNCSSDLNLPFMPPQALDPLMKASCVFAILKSPDIRDELLYPTLALTSRADNDPCLLAGINWEKDFVKAGPPGLPCVLFNATQSIMLAAFAPCVSTVFFRSTSSRPCPPSPSECPDRLRPTLSYITGERRVTYIAGLEPSDCFSTTLEAEKFTRNMRGSLIITALPPQENGPRGDNCF